MVARSTGEARPQSTVSTTAKAMPANWPMRIGRAWPTMPRTMDPLPRMLLTRFVPEPRRRRRLAGLDEPRVLPLEDRHDVGHGHVGVGTALAHVLHVAPAGAVVRLEHRALAAVEFQRHVPEPLAQRPVEGRRHLNPTPPQRKLV